ncbi:hypothetical protein [Puia dinghuensis]|uniref:Uncharacterized protein n=1 Tax=Puia dinghuensis TaxID=1792502 RepID=A0A8J2UHA8_9BACT|nr:hypothetical protein [Puia dinghuensis]GGB17993.1 hypothetical protein GCM10011511_47220 [Puia dinghuensis]
MKLLPYEKYTLSTPLTIPEAQQHLLTQLEATRYWSISIPKENKPYIGTLTADGFTMKRIITGRKAFLPIITGRFSNADGKTTIAIRMRPHTFELVMVIVGMGFLGAAGISALLTALRDVRNHAADIAYSASIPILMFFGIYALMTMLFQSEVAQSKKFLAGLFKPE